MMSGHLENQNLSLSTLRTENLTVYRINKNGSSSAPGDLGHRGFLLEKSPNFI